MRVLVGVVVLAVVAGLVFFFRPTPDTVQAPATPSPSASAAPSPPPPAPFEVDGPTEEELAQCVVGEGDLLSRLGSAPIEAPDAPAQVEEITERVVALRGLPEEEDVLPQFLSGAEIEARTAALVAEEYSDEDADLDRRLLTALGAVPADIDLRAVQSELLSGQIEGFYETESRDLVVRTEDPGQPLGPSEQITLAHEIEHALADQAFGLDLDADLPGDGSAAQLALIEGDATLTMQRFSIEAFDLAQQQELLANPEVAASVEQLAEYPHALTATLLFSYEEGLAFVCDRYAEGGWAAVDAAYQQRPQTTSEILFPDRYPLQPVEPRAPAPPGGAWQERRTDTLGAADLKVLFEAPGDVREAALDQIRPRVADWNGGRFALYTSGEATALGVALVGGAHGQPPLCDSVGAWYDAAFPDAADTDAQGATLARIGPGQSMVLACQGDDVRLGIAPDLPTAHALTL